MCAITKIEEYPDEALNKVLNLNVKSAFHLTVGLRKTTKKVKTWATIRSTTRCGKSQWAWFLSESISILGTSIVGQGVGSIYSNMTARTKFIPCSLSQFSLRRDCIKIFFGSQMFGKGKDAQDQDKSKIEDFLVEFLGFFGLLVLSLVIVEHLSVLSWIGLESRILHFREHLKKWMLWSKTWPSKFARLYNRELQSRFDLAVTELLHMHFTHHITSCLVCKILKY